MEEQLDELGGQLGEWRRFWPRGFNDQLDELESRLAELALCEETLNLQVCVLFKGP